MAILSRSNRRLALTFTAAVLLPCVVLVGLTIRAMQQEQELAEKRTADFRSAMVVEAKQAARSYLDAIATRIMRSQVSHPTTAGRPVRRDAEVVFIAPIEGGRLIAPWDRRPQPGGDSSAEWSTLVQKAEFQEFNRSNAPEAERLWHAAIEHARLPDLEAYARLGLARTLRKEGRSREAAAHYRNLLRLPVDVSDEHGVPFFLYAASALSQSDPVAVRARLDSVGDVCCLPAEALHMWRHAVTSAVSLTGSETERAAASTARLLDDRIADADQANTLREEFDRLAPMTSQRSDSRADVQRWIVWGTRPWLMSVVMIPGETHSVLVALGAAAVVDSVNSRLMSNRSTARLTLSTDDDTTRVPLSADLEGLAVRFTGDAGMSVETGASRAFHVGTLILVIGVTLFGASFLWLDVRREMRSATLRGQFVASVSHELKTPLTAIRMFAETLALPDPLPETTRREYLDTIVSESERLTRLLNNVLDFSKIERGQKTYQREPTDLSEVVRRTARTLEYPLAQQGFRLRVETEDGPGAVLADEDALEQAVLNLLTNAMKYSGRSREIDLRVRRVNGDAVIEVEDHGIGIPEEYRSRVTEKFYRVPTPENAGIPGTGLGLTLVDHIAAGHGGRLEIVSGVGSGTRAVIRLPLATES